MTRYMDRNGKVYEAKDAGDLIDQMREGSFIVHNNRQEFMDRMARFAGRIYELRLNPENEETFLASMIDQGVVVRPMDELWRLYDERFGIGTITIFNQDPEILAERMREALRTGKPVEEPELPPGVVI